jgi:hypothetical protein
MMMVLRIAKSPEPFFEPLNRRSRGRLCPSAGDGSLMADVSVLSGAVGQYDRGVSSKAKGRRRAMNRHAIGLLALVVALAWPWTGALGDDRKHDQDMARHAVERGEIKPLAEIFKAVRSKLPGEVVGVEIEQKKGRWFYELRVADAKGRLFEVYVDARSGTIDRIKEK